MSTVTAGCTVESPWGPVVLEARADAVSGVYLGVARGGKEPCPPALRAAVDAVERYFEAGTTDFEGPLDLNGVSDFDRAVYRELRKVPTGRVLSYGELAGRIGRPGAARAVGGAMGRNPLPLLVPCHRVIRSDGRMGGFGAGLHWKRRLLKHEGWNIDADKVTRP